MKNIALNCRLEAFIQEKDYFDTKFNYKGNILIYKLLGWCLTVDDQTTISSVYELFETRDNDRFEYIIPIDENILNLIKKSTGNYRDIIIIFKNVNSCVTIDVIESGSLSKTLDIDISKNTIKKNRIDRNDIQEYVV